MLQLKGIEKEYIAGDTRVKALKGVDIAFRKSEFVSILGPSGCGKTTLLNIIGGLDHYTAGDLTIDGVSTKQYTDRDWDTYRNHRIGFVFQSYNLIPHQTISENVELALNISGVEKAERIRRAHEALDKVGLVGQYNKKPNQLSGGQCQRVAIARALVNNPEILLADEPTGALDTVTSEQIMELIREVSRGCLVIMVTHNPELAEKYSTRIVKLLDGNIEGDSDPFDGIEEVEQSDEKTLEQSTSQPDGVVELDSAPARPKTKKSKLSFWSAFRLSLKNLLSKFKRTFLVCLAGSIGIIGVATVLAVSSGVQNYIRDMQDDMLSGNPVQISTEGFDLSAMMSASMNAQAQAVKGSLENGYVRVDKMIEYLVNRGDDMSAMTVKNDITKEYVEFVKAMPKEYYAAIATHYGINLSNNLYTDYTFTTADGEETKQMSLAAAATMYESMLDKTEYKDFAGYISLVKQNFLQAPDNKDFILSQYDIISDSDSSKIAEEADEIMIVVSRDTELTDILLAQYGYYSQNEFFNMVFDAVDDEHYDPAIKTDKISYDDLLGKTFTWYPNNTVFEQYTPGGFDPTNKIMDRSAYKYKPFADGAWTTGKPLKVTAILRPKASISYGCMESGFYYTQKLADEVVANGIKSDIVRYLNEKESEGFQSMSVTQTDETFGDYTLLTGVTFSYSYYLQYGDRHDFDEIGFVGNVSNMSIIGNMMGIDLGSARTLTLRELGGIDVPAEISVYPVNFDIKDNVTAYLDKWNADGDITVGDKTLTKADRTEIIYTDNLAVIISLINDLINIVTAALIAFTALSLVVSTVMIAIITYVSVIERVKEIGVIRSLGGRKRDVSALFNAETFIIGGVSGVLGIAVTYIISGILNLILGSLFGIYTIAALPVWQALVIIAISIGLTLISGLIPARLAAKKDPVVALRTE